MTKLTQQQRREQKTHNNLNNRDVSEHNNYMSSNIKNIYPNVNVIFIILAYENVISNIKKLYEFTKDDNNIIIINNNNTIHFTKFYSYYMDLHKVPSHAWSKIDDNISVMLVRGTAIILAQKSEIYNCELFNNTLKSSLKLRVKECLICFHNFFFKEKRVTCCHCMMPICHNCFITYIKNNSGWCPYCRQHLLFNGLGKTSMQSDDIGDIFDAFVGDEMRTRINQNDAITSVPASYLMEKWMLFDL